MLVLDASDGVGGRVRTDRTAEGFRLDRGFQILLTDYPEARRIFDYQALDLRYFRSGAVIRLADGRETTLENPLDAPLAAFAALAAPIGTLQDKLLIAKLVAQLQRPTPEQLLARPAVSTLDFLRRYGWSEQIINSFFRPFFGGVYLDRELRTASNFFEFVFQQFARGRVALPALGIGALPEQLAARLPTSALRLSAPVAAVLDGGRRVRLASGETLEAAAVVLATDGPAAARLLGVGMRDERLEMKDEEVRRGTGEPTELAGQSAGLIPHPPSLIPNPESFIPNPTLARTTTCTYFATTGPVPSHGARLIHLQARRDGLVHNVAFPAEVSPALAPAGQGLISVSTHGAHGLAEEELTARLRPELADWFGPRAHLWRHLRTYFIPAGLPAYEAGQPVQQELRLGDTLFRCGDWVSYPSLNAALGTGRQVAELLS